MKKFIKGNKKGFTLIELIVVIAILAILAAILIPQFGGFTKKAASSQALMHAKQIATAADALIAEGKTTYTGGTASATSAEFSDDDIVAIAGTDITGTISAGSVASNRFVFTYTLTYKSTVYTAVRVAAGEITVTWP